MEEPRKTNDACSGSLLILDRDQGPRIGVKYLLVKTAAGFSVPPLDAIEDIFETERGAAIDASRVGQALAAIARALNAGDVALAALATDHLRANVEKRFSLRKAGVDDPRPGWPAKTPGGLGGKFRPRSGIYVANPAQIADRAARLERLKARRSVRAVLRRVLTAKRLARLLLEGVGEVVPVLDTLDTAALLEDVGEIVGEITEGNADIDAATAFVERGPQTLEELSVSAEEESFPSFDAFKKFDLEKRFGPAGEGYEYHHIVEQSAAREGISSASLNSTRNIIRIPKLLHEEINAYFAKTLRDSGLTARQALQGSSYEARRAAGLAVLRNLGVLYP